MTIVREVMNPKVVRILPDARLDDAIRQLYAEDCGGAPVVSREGQLLGVISELAFLDALFDRGFRNAPVAEFMTRQVHFVEPEDTLEHVAHMFELYRIRRLPVLESGQVVGIVTRRDLIRHVLATNESLSNPLESLLPRVEEMSV
jgi:tRNA nucleotidyltransferase (CCA-adding enzyme)